MDRPSDRRSHRRVPFCYPVEVVHGEHYLASCPSCDISEGGLQLATELPDVAQVKLVVGMMQEDSLRGALIKGEVAWHQTKHTGIRFVDLPPEMLSMLRAYVEEQARKGAN